MRKAVWLGCLLTFSVLNAPAETPYDLYSRHFFQNHIRAGLPADREICGSSFCKDRYEGFQLKETAIRTGWLLAWMAKDHQLGLSNRETTLRRIHETLDALLRLGKYGSKESVTLLNEIRRLGLPTVREELQIRQNIFKNLPATGFLLRSDLDKSFDSFVEDRVATHDLDPDLDFYVSVLFGLVSVKKFVGDTAANRKISDISLRIFTTMQRMGFDLIRTWDLKRVSGRSRLKPYRYSLYLAFRYLIDDALMKPLLHQKGFNRFKWITLEPFKLQTPYYSRRVSLYLMEAFLSLEDNPKWLAKNKRRFERRFAKKVLVQDPNPLLAAVASGFYGLNTPSVKNAFAQLDDVPKEGLPNTTNRVWKNFLSFGERRLTLESERLPWASISDREELSPLSLPDEPMALLDPVAAEGLEYSGLDYLLPQAYRP